MNQKYTENLAEFIYEKSAELGIHAAAIGSAEEYESLQSEYYSDEKFIKISDYFPEAKSFISAALSYKFDWNNKPNNSAGYIARYTTANFYKMLTIKLKALGNAIQDYFKSGGKDFFRVFVNSKANDKLAGYTGALGASGKNSLLIVNDLGSQAVLGELFLPIKIKTADVKNKKDDKCGKCTKCIDACPTNAIKENCRLNKNLCIQHLSGVLDWPESIDSKDFLCCWRTRFFGCTDCIDVCPYNLRNQVFKQSPDKTAGYVGTAFDFENILKFKKGDYKSYFKNNQLSASWIPETAHVRNTLASLHNLGRKDLIKKFLENIDDYNWESDEKEYLKNFIKFSLKI
jgi:epoxyqueuosine reductase QueG